MSATPRPKKEWIRIGQHRTSKDEVDFLNILRIPEPTSDKKENANNFAKQVTLYLSQKLDRAPPSLDPSLHLNKKLKAFDHIRFEKMLEKAAIPGDPNNIESAEKIQEALTQFSKWRKKIRETTDLLPLSVLLTEPLKSSHMLELERSLKKAQKTKNDKKISELNAEIKIEQGRIITKTVQSLTGQTLAILGGSEPLKKLSMETWANTNFELGGNPEKFNAYCCTDTHTAEMIKKTLAKTSRLKPPTIFCETEKGIIKGADAVRQILQNLSMQPRQSVVEIYDVIEAIKKMSPTKEFDSLCEDFAKKNPQYDLNAERDRRALERQQASAALVAKLEEDRQKFKILAAERAEEKEKEEERKRIKNQSASSAAKEAKNSNPLDKAEEESREQSSRPRPS